MIVSSDEEDYLNQILYNFYINQDFKILSNLRDERAMSFFDIKPTKYHLRSKRNEKRFFYVVFKKIRLEVKKNI